MSQNLVVNGKKYVPSADLARDFGYTPDYVSRLAREKKVAATNINRKWFVQEDSFREFISESTLGKEIRKSELKKQRQVERILYGRKNIETKATPEYIALVQSMSVFMCGIFLGFLGWTVAGNNIGVQDFAYGIENTYTHIAKVIVPRDSSLEIFTKWSVASVLQPQMTVLESSDNEQNYIAPIPQLVDVVDPNNLKFSDEVDIIYEDDGYAVVRPIFKNETKGRKYRVYMEYVE